MNHYLYEYIFCLFGHVQLIYNFVEGSPSRHAFLENIARQTNLRLKTLKSLSTTRWACRSEAVNAVETNYSSLLECLVEIADTTKLSETRAKANSLLNQIKNYNFIFVLYIIKPILIEISIVSSELQKPDMNQLEAISLINALQKSFF